MIVAVCVWVCVFACVCIFVFVCVRPFCYPLSSHHRNLVNFARVFVCVFLCVCVRVCVCMCVTLSFSFPLIITLTQSSISTPHVHVCVSGCVWKRVPWYSPFHFVHIRGREHAFSRISKTAKMYGWAGRWKNEWTDGRTDPLKETHHTHKCAAEINDIAMMRGRT